jgi:hypothetical protein
MRVRVLIARAFADGERITDCPIYASAQPRLRLRIGGAESAKSAQVLADFNALDISAPICDNGTNADLAPFAVGQALQPDSVAASGWKA